jgi:Sperm-tail PG-rich repeat
LQITVENKAETPGPGEYSPKGEFSKTGEYFLSKFRSTGAKTLYKSRRETLQHLNVDKYCPGPGMYKLPSDFGYPDLAFARTQKLVMRRSSSQI